MIVTAIAKEGWGDKFNSGDEIKGEAIIASVDWDKFRKNN